LTTRSDANRQRDESFDEAGVRVQRRQSSPQERDLLLRRPHALGGPLAPRPPGAVKRGPAVECPTSALNVCGRRQRTPVKCDALLNPFRVLDHLGLEEEQPAPASTGGVVFRQTSDVAPRLTLGVAVGDLYRRRIRSDTFTKPVGGQRSLRPQDIPLLQIPPQHGPAQGHHPRSLLRRWNWLMDLEIDQPAGGSVEVGRGEAVWNRCLGWGQRCELCSRSAHLVDGAKCNVGGKW
jgi:hypothetical protein